MIFLVASLIIISCMLIFGYRAGNKSADADRNTTIISDLYNAKEARDSMRHDMAERNRVRNKYTRD